MLEPEVGKELADALRHLAVDAKPVDVEEAVAILVGERGADPRHADAPVEMTRWRYDVWLLKGSLPAERGVTVRILSDCQCLCTTMYRIDEPHLLWALDQLCGISPSGKEREPTIPNQIRVHAEIRRDALLALDRMMTLSAPAMSSD